MGAGDQVSVDIDTEFADLADYYPGSRRPRRSAPDVAAVVEWDSRPVVKTYNGVETEFFMPGAFAKALGKSAVTIRLWERKGYIPRAPFRLPGYQRAGKTVLGKRVYTRELIAISVEEFASRNLLHVPRVEWSQHHDLTIAIYERWNANIATSA